MEKLYYLLYPMRVCLITSSYSGKDNIMAAAWVYPFSFDPPLFGVSVSKKRFSYDLIKKGSAFGINTCSPDMKEAVLVCGRRSGKEIDKFKEAKLTKEKGKFVPLIKESPASIECEVIKEIEMGDHVLFVGRVINVLKRKEGKGLYHAGGDNFLEI
ncbi:MAG: flavin reductase family protein [Candidatus Anstonellales archaeon]